MTTTSRRRKGTAALGAVATLILLALFSRSARAEKADPECLNRNASLCQQIEKCSGGFEPNGTCKWILTVTRYYWGN